jgi:hypothetical protein
MREQEEIQKFSFQYHVMPRLIDYITDIIEADKSKEEKLKAENLKLGKKVEEKTTQDPPPHPRQETLNRLNKHGGFCSAFSLLTLTSTLLSKIPKKDSSPSESKKVRDDYETMSHLFEIVARRNTLERGEEKECDAACERIINYLFSIQMVVDTQKTQQPIIEHEDKLGQKKYIPYYEAVRMVIPDKKVTETDQPLKLEFQITGYAADKSTIKKFIDFIQEDRIFLIGIHDSKDTALKDDGHTIGLLRTVESGTTVYYFVDQNAENIRIKIDNIDQAVEEILSAAKKVKCDGGLLIQCQSLQLNLAGLETKAAKYPDKNALLESVYAPEINILCNTYAALNYDTESAEFYQNKKQSSQPFYIDLLNDNSEEFDDILPSIFPTLNFPLSTGDKIMANATFINPELISRLNETLKEMDSKISFEKDSKRDHGVIIHNLTRETLKAAAESPKFPQFLALTKGPYHSKASGALDLRSHYSPRFLAPKRESTKKEEIEHSPKIVSPGIK